MKRSLGFAGDPEPKYSVKFGTSTSSDGQSAKPPKNAPASRASVRYAVPQPKRGPFVCAYAHAVSPRAFMMAAAGSGRAASASAGGPGVLNAASAPSKADASTSNPPALPYASSTMLQAVFCEARFASGTVASYSSKSAVAASPNARAPRRVRGSVRRVLGAARRARAASVLGAARRARAASRRAPVACARGGPLRAAAELTKSKTQRIAQTATVRQRSSTSRDLRGSTAADEQKLCVPLNASRQRLDHRAVSGALRD
mmetsp:Transcript_16592/g.51642  ORF Transcript_16592/g.51642 Transcript_16592/m.51642 type:complete len:258 (+) Transcript_16592:1602-2375(+)